MPDENKYAVDFVLQLVYSNCTGNDGNVIMTACGRDKCSVTSVDNPNECIHNEASGLWHTEEHTFTMSQS